MTDPERLQAARERDLLERRIDRYRVRNAYLTSEVSRLRASLARHERFAQGPLPVRPGKTRLRLVPDRGGS